MDRKQLADIAVGDRVWVTNSHGYHRERIQTVARLTPTLIILDEWYSGGAKSEFNRYRRGKPSRYGGKPSYRQISSGMFASSIESVATAAECAKWDAEQSQKATEETARKRERARVDALARELSALFGEAGGVSESHYAEPGSERWCVTFYSLSEPEVRALAVQAKAVAHG